MVLVFVAGVSVVSASVSYQIRPGNQINQQIPHFQYMNDRGLCMSGDIFVQHMVLDRVSGTGTAEADINAYNLDDRDRVRIVLRTMNLMPKTVYTVWMTDSMNMYIGEFKTNSNGRGTFTFKQQMEDFTTFNDLVIMKGSTVVFSGPFDNICSQIS